MAGLLAGAIFAGGGVNAADDEIAQGKQVYEQRCAMCHGRNGTGDGPNAASLSKRPENFTAAEFWEHKNIDSMITATILNGKGVMPSIPLNQKQITQVIAYMSKTFKPAGKG